MRRRCGSRSFEHDLDAFMPLQQAVLQADDRLPDVLLVVEWPRRRTRRRTPAAWRHGVLDLSEHLDNQATGRKSRGFRAETGNEPRVVLSSSRYRRTRRPAFAPARAVRPGLRRGDPAAGRGPTGTAPPVAPAARAGRREEPAVGRHPAGRPSAGRMMPVGFPQAWAGALARGRPAWLNWHERTGRPAWPGPSAATRSRPGPATPPGRPCPGSGPGRRESRRPAPPAAPPIARSRAASAAAARPPRRRGRRGAGRRPRAVRAKARPLW